MSVIIRLQGLPWSASALDIRNFFTGLQIPAGGVHIIGGDKGDAFIAFSTDEDARQGMMKTFQNLNGSPVQLLLSSKTEMQNVIDAARTGQAIDQPVEPTPKALPVDQPRQYEDPYNRGPPPVQDARVGFRDEFQDPSQPMFGGEQAGYREDLPNQAPWNEGSQGRYPDAGYVPDNRPQFGGRDSFQRDGIPKDGFRADGPPPRDGFSGNGPPPRDGFRGDGPPPRDGFMDDGPPRDGFRGEGPPPRDGFSGNGPPPRDGFRGDGPPRDGFRGDGPPPRDGFMVDGVPPRDSFRGDGPPRDGFRGEVPPRDDFKGPRPTNDWFQRDGPPRDVPPIEIRNTNIPGDRIPDLFPVNPPPDQYGAPPFDRAPIGEPPFNRNQGPPAFGGRTETPADVRPPQDIRRPDQRGGEYRRGSEGRSEGRNGRDQRDRDGREGREGRERDSRDGRESRDRRDRSDRDRTDRDRPDRDRSDRDRSSRSDRDRSSRSDRSDRSDRRSDRSERGSDRERRDHSESRRGDSKESKETKDRPTSAEKPSSDSRHPREPSRGPPGRTRADFMGSARPFSEPSNQVPPNDPRHRPADGSFPPRDGDRPRSRFDQERPPGDLQPGRLSGDDRRPQPPQDPDFRPDQALRGPPDGPRGLMDGPRGPMDGPRGPMDGPRGPMDGPRGPLDGPRGPMDGPRGPMDGPRGPMDGPRGQMDGPRGPMDGPRGPMDGPRGPMDGPRRPRDGPRGPYDGPRGSMDGPRGPMDGPRGPMDGPRGPMDGPRGPMDGPRGPMDGPRDGFRGPMDDPRGPVDGPRDGFRGPMDGSRGRGPPMFPDQGNGFDRDSRPPDRDFRGGPPGEGGFHQRKPMPPLGRGRPGDGGPPGIGPRGLRDEGFQRGPDEGRGMNGPWDMERFPGGPPGRPAPRQDFGDSRPGPSAPVSKGLLGDAPGMLPPVRGMMDRGDVKMDHDGREPKRPFPPDRPGPGPFGRPGEMPDFGRGPGEFDEMQRYKGRDMDPRSNRDAQERGPRPMATDERGPRQMIPDDRRRGDWGGPDGGREGQWPDDRGPPRGRPVDRDEGPYAHRSRPPHMDEQSRKRPRQPEEGNVYLRLKNLPFNVSYSMIRRFFTGCDIPYDGLKLLNDEQGKRNGTAFVRFMTEESSYNGLKRNGFELIGRNVVVNRCTVTEFDGAVDSYIPDDEEEEGGADPPKRPRSDVPQEVNKTTSFSTEQVVKVSNLPLNASIEEIRNQMTNVEIAGHGSSLVMEYDTKGSFTGVAYVEVLNADNYQRALAIEGKHMGSRILRACGSSKADLNKSKLTQPKSDSTSSKTQKVQKTPDKKIDNETVSGDINDFLFYCVVLTGLPPASSYREVREFFSGLEIVPRGIQISHDGSGNPTGEAYVEFSTKKDCKEALKRDQQMVLQNKVTVKPILKTELIHNLRNARNIISSSPGVPPVNQNPGITKPIPPGVLKRQWVYLRCSNLPLQVTIRELLAFFHKYNPVPESIRLHYTGDGNPTGNAVVGFPTKVEAAKAMADLNGTMCRRNSVVIANA